MTGSAPYNKKGERWVNHTISPGSYVVNDPRPPAPTFTRPTGQTWARPVPPPPAPPPPPAKVAPSSVPPNPYAINTTAPPPGQPLPPAPVPQAFQTPAGKTPRFYDPDDFRKFTETHGNSSAISFQSSYPTPARDVQGRTFLPVVGDTQKRGPYSERLTRTEEVELLRVCMKYKETFNAPSCQNKWWLVVAADFSVYRRSFERSDLQAPTAKRRVELAIARRKKEIEDGRESDEPADYVEALDAWVEHNDKLERGDITPMNSKQAAESKLDEAIERIKKEREVVEKEHPMAAPPPPPSMPRSASAPGPNSDSPIMISNSPSRQAPPQLHPLATAYPAAYAPPSQAVTPHTTAPPPDPRPVKRQRTDDGPVPNGELAAVVAKLGPAIESMSKLASEMYEWRKSEREDREAKQRHRTPVESDVDMNGTSDNLFSPAPAGSDSRVDELERRLQEQRDANEALQTNLDDINAKITKFTEEVEAAENREKDRDKKIDKILQVLKKHFQTSGGNMTSSQS